MTAIENIRNIALVGHSSAGKTSLAEAILHKTGVTNRLGSVLDKSSILDVADDEKEKQCSIDTAICHVEHDGVKINIIDTPGGTDFCGQAIAGLNGADTAVLVISASAGIEVNTRKMMERAGEFGMARMIVINKVLGENTNTEELIETIQEFFGSECIPVNLPGPGLKGAVDCFANEAGEVAFGDVEDAHTQVVEAIAGSDEALMEKYLEGELQASELTSKAAEAVASGELIPIVFTDAKEESGIAELLDAIKLYCANPLIGPRRTLAVGEGEEATETEIEPKEDAELIGQVIRVSTKANIKYSVIRILSGKLASDTNVKTHNEPKGLRPGQPHFVQGTEYPDTDTGCVGDIIALAKIDLKVGDTICSGAVGDVKGIPAPKPMCSKAVTSKSRGDEEKVSGALKRFTEEDPCFIMERIAQTGELIIHGIGDLHIQTLLGRMARQNKLEVDLHPQKIPYRETITGRAENVEYTHKKQSGGSGQFGRVIINVIAAERGEGYEFVDKIFGGAIDQQYRPAVDKGIRAQMVEGVLAGCPVVDVKVELVDGKTHPVDSKDIAFQIAGRQAFKEGFKKAKPILLEPIVNLEVTCPNDFVGDIQGDVASRRGRPMGQESLPGNLAVIKAQVPLAEVSDYNSRLSSITGGQGSYAMEFSHYDTVPSNVQQQIIAAAEKKEEE